VAELCRREGIAANLYYRWYQRFLEHGFDGLEDKQPARRAGWNRIPQRIKDQVLELALERTHEMWQTDFTYFRIVGWGCYYLSTVLDDFPRYIIAWKLTPTMGASDVTETLDEALATTGADRVKVHHRPRKPPDRRTSAASGRRSAQ
jgi:transposase InsO family protein